MSTNLVPFSGSFGTHNEFIKEHNHEGLEAWPHYKEDPWGEFTGGEVLKIDNSFGSFGVKLVNQIQALTPGREYTFSMYLATDTMVGQIGNLVVSGASDAAGNQTDPEFSAFTATRHSVTRSIFQGAQPPVIHNGNGDVHHFVGTGTDADWPDYAKFGINIPAGKSEDIFIQFWYQALVDDTQMGLYYGYRREDKEDPPGSGTILPQLPIYKEFGLYSPPRKNDAQYLNAFVTATPSDYDPTYGVDVGFLIPNKGILLQGIKIIRAPKFESQYYTITQDKGWVRLEITFIASDAMGGVDTPVWLPGVDLGNRRSSRPVELKFNWVNTPAPGGSAEPLYVTGLQLVEGPAPVPWVREWDNMRIRPFYNVNINKVPKPNLEFLQAITIKAHTGVNYHETGIPQIGINLPFIDYWTSDPVFLNLAKQMKFGPPRMEKDKQIDASGKINHVQVLKQNAFVVTENKWNADIKLDLDADGYPNSVPAGSKIVLLCGRTTPLDWFVTDHRAPHYPSGIYVLKWDGDAEIEPKDTWGWLKPGTYRYQVYKKESNRLEIEFITEGGFEPSYGTNTRKQADIATGFWFEMSSCSPNFRNLVFCEKRYENLINQGQYVYPEFMEKLYDYAGIRFMHWQIINEVFIKTWDDMPKLSHAGWCARGTPLEVMIQVCNMLHRHMWINIPAALDNNGVRKMAELLRDTMDPDLKIYVEYANEFWNGGFWQNGWLQEFAQKNGIERNPLDVAPDWEVVLQAFGMRNAQVMDIFEEVFSGPNGYRKPARQWDPPKRRLFRVTSSFYGGTKTSQDVAKYTNAESVNFKPDYDDGKASDCITPGAYWANTVGAADRPFTTFQQMVDLAQDHLNAFYLNPNSVNGHAVKMIQTPYGDEYKYMDGSEEVALKGIGQIPVIYEGNAHLAQNGGEPAWLKFHEWVYSPEAADQMWQQLDWWCNITNYDPDAMYFWFEAALMASASGAFGHAPKSVNMRSGDYWSIPRAGSTIKRAGLQYFPTIRQGTPAAISDHFFQGWKNGL